MIKRDKVLHFLAGTLITIACLYSGKSLADTAWVVLAIAAMKEVIDFYRHGHPDIYDVYATMFGWVFVILLLLGVYVYANLAYSPTYILGWIPL